MSTPVSLGQSKRVRVAIVDDDRKILLLHRRLVEATGDCDCVGTFLNAHGFLQVLPSTPAQVVLMDIRMPGMTGLECTSLVRRRRPELKVIIVTGLAENHAVTAALQEGAHYYLVKPVQVEQLKTAIHFVMNREHGLSRKELWPRPAVELRGLEVSCPVPSPPFSARECRVLELLSAGKLYKEIADSLGTSASVVRKLVHGIYDRLGVHSRIEALHLVRSGQRPALDAKESLDEQ